MESALVSCSHCSIVCVQLSESVAFIDLIMRGEKRFVNETQNFDFLLDNVLFVVDLFRQNGIRTDACTGTWYRGLML